MTIKPDKRKDAEAPTEARERPPRRQPRRAHRRPRGVPLPRRHRRPRARDPGGRGEGGTEGGGGEGFLLAGTITSRLASTSVYVETPDATRPIVSGLRGRRGAGDCARQGGNGADCFSRRRSLIPDIVEPRERLRRANKWSAIACFLKGNLRRCSPLVILQKMMIIMMIVKMNGGCLSPSLFPFHTAVAGGKFVFFFLTSENMLMNQERRHHLFFSLFLICLSLCFLCFPYPSAC